MSELVREVGKYFVTSQRFIQQAGQNEPELVHGTPQAPVVVNLYTTSIVKDADGNETLRPLKEDAHLKAVKPRAPKSVTPPSVLTAPMTAPEFEEAQSKPSRGRGRGRAADE